MSDSLRPHEPQHARPPCPSPTPRVHPNSCPLSRWCHPNISPSVIPFSSCPWSLPASGSFQMNQLFTSGGQSTGVSALASVLPMNTQDWSPLGWTGWISLHSLKLYFLCISLIFFHVCLLSSISHVSLFLTPLGCSLPGSSVPGTLQARILEWVPCRLPWALLNSGIEPVSCIAGGFSFIELPGW